MKFNFFYEPCIIYIINQLSIIVATADFPKDFIFGVGTAAYQIEGGWNTSGKGENIWDFETHNNPGYVVDHSNADIACNSYEKFRDDVKILSDLGVHVYRFSISWSRLLPTGHSNVINEDGKRYYNELINELLKHNIVPMVTLYHWDLPQPLQELGGWPNPLLADYFTDYADVAFSLFGDRVKLWITFNEPFNVCEEGYGIGAKAPCYKQYGVGDYLCAHTLLNAHAKAYRLYEEKYKKNQNGKIGMAVDTRWYEPKTKKGSDEQIAHQAFVMWFNWFIEPIVFGNYPQLMINRIAQTSREENFKKSRLPVFTVEEQKRLRGSFDFIGLNYYTSRTGSFNASMYVKPIPSYERDANVVVDSNPDWETAGPSWLKIYPTGLYKILMFIKNHLNNPVVYITENGYGTEDIASLNDTDRIRYQESHLQKVSEAIRDGCNVKGYFVWSLMDNFEWESGYSYRFGLYYINFLDPNLERVPKASATWYKNLILHHLRRHNLSYANQIFNESSRGSFIQFFDMSEINVFIFTVIVSMYLMPLTQV